MKASADPVRLPVRFPGPRPWLVVPLAAAILWSADGLASGPAEAQTAGATLEVLVTDSVGRPLWGAHIQLERLGFSTLTDSSGHLRLYNVPPGPLAIVVGHLGHRLDSARVRLRAGRVHRVTVSLETEPIPVGEVRVAVADRRRQLDFLRGFEERRERGIGHFLTREEIEESGTSNLSNLLHMVPGIRTSPSQFGESRMRAVRTPVTRQCEIKVYVDGVEYRNGSDVVGIPTADIEAIEVYRGRSELPAEFADTDANCGAIVIWTRRFRARP